MNSILMLSQAPFPPDIRLEKEIKSLSEAGYKLIVVCNQYDKNLSPGYEYCDIKRVKAPFRSIKLNRILNFPIFINPRFLIRVFKAILSDKPSYLHAHDLPMMPIAIFGGKIFRLPIIFDMHENYPEALRQFEKKGITNFIFKNYRLAKVLEKICVKFSHRIIVVVKENKNRLKNIKVKPENIFVVSNTFDINTFSVTKDVSKRIEIKSENRDIILYTGTVSPDRGLLTAIQSAFYFKEIGINPLMFIVGEGSYKNFLTDYVNKNNLNNYIRFLDWPGHRNIPLYIQKAKICMIPQPSNDFINTTIPHKLFEYMFMEKPVIVSDAIPLRRIVEETNAGKVFISGNARNFAETVKLMLTKVDSWGINGKKAVLNRYNWHNDAQVLIEMYNNLDKKLKKQSTKGKI